MNTTNVKAINLNQIRGNDPKTEKLRIILKFNCSWWNFTNVEKLYSIKRKKNLKETKFDLLAKIAE